MREIVVGGFDFSWHLVIALCSRLIVNHWKRLCIAQAKTFLIELGDQFAANCYHNSAGKIRPSSYDMPREVFLIYFQFKLWPMRILILLMVGCLLVVPVTAQTLQPLGELRSPAEASPIAAAVPMLQTDTDWQATQAKPDSDIDGNQGSSEIRDDYWLENGVGSRLVSGVVDVPPHVVADTAWIDVPEAPGSDAILNQSEKIDFSAKLNHRFLTESLLTDQQLSNMLRSGEPATTNPNSVQYVAYLEEGPITAAENARELKSEVTNENKAKVVTGQPTNRLDWLEKAVLAELETVKADSAVDENTKSTRLNVLTSATEWIQKSKGYNAKAESFRSEIDGFHAALSTAQEQLKISESALPPPPPDANRPTEELQRESQRISQELEIKKTELENLHAAQQRYTVRITEAPKQKSEAQKRLKKVQERVSEADPTEADLHDESKLLQFAIRAATQAEIDMLNREANFLELSSQLSPVRIDLTKSQLKQLETQATALKLAAERARQREVEQQIRLAKQAALDAHPQLAHLATRNQELAKQRKEIAEKIVSISDETAKVTTQTTKVESDLSSLQKRVAEGLNSANTMMLAESRRQLVSPLESRVRLGSLRSEMQSVNLSVSVLQEERETLADPEYVMSKQLDFDPATVDQHLKTMAVEFIEGRRRLIDDLLNDYRSYRRLLVETTVQRDKLIAGIAGTNELLNKHMLWVRSANPISVNSLRKSSEGFQEFLSADRWSELVSRLIDRARRQPYEYLMFTIGFAFLYGVVRRLKG